MLKELEKNIFGHFKNDISFYDLIEKSSDNEIKLNDIKILEKDLVATFIKALIYSESIREIFYKILQDKNEKIKEIINKNIFKNNLIKPINISLQEDITHIRNKLNKDVKRLLVLIKSKYNDKIIVEKQKDKKQKNKEERAIIDILINYRNLILGIEAKLGASKDNNQIQKYIECLEIEEDNYIEIYWEDIYSKLKKITKNEKIENFIINQFKEYMEVIGMTDFQGIPFVLNANGEFQSKFNYSEARKILKKIEIKLRNDYRNIKTKYQKNVPILWCRLDKKDPAGRPHISICLNELDNFTIDLYIQSSKVNIKDKNIKQIFEIVFEKIKNNVDNTWFFNMLNFKNYSGNLGGKSYSVFNLSLNLNEKHDKKVLNQLNELFKKINELKAITIARKFYYDNPYYNINLPYEIASGNQINMASEEFYGTIEETIKILWKIFENLKEHEYIIDKKSSESIK